VDEDEDELLLEEDELLRDDEDEPLLDDVRLLLESDEDPRLEADDGPLLDCDGPADDAPLLDGSACEHLQTGSPTLPCPAFESASAAAASRALDWESGSEESGDIRI